MRTFALLVVIVAIQGSCGTAVAQEQDAEDVQFRRWMQFYANEAKAIRIRFDDEPQAELEFEEEPVLQWTNPTRANEIHGAVYVWTHQGRAEVMGTIWSNVTSSDSANRHVGHQFHSLSTRPLVAEKRGERFWYPRTAGIEPKPIPEAPPPAQTRSLRLAQMRALAREFDGDGEEFNTRRGIRLLTQPLHRQEKPLDDCLDGALFTFAMGTDPELILLIEARPTDDGPRWHYSIGRFSGLHTDFRYKDQVVWQYRGPAQQLDPRQPYLASYNVRVMPKEIGEQ